MSSDQPSEKPSSAFLRMRLRADDTHYAGGTIPGATYLAFMADACAMLMILRGEPAGFLARWESADFSTPCNVGDYIEVRCTLVRVGNRSRRLEAEVVRLVRTSVTAGETSVGEVPDPPDIVARGTYVGVIPRNQAS